MRRARSQPLGANRFRTIQVLGDLKLYEDRIAAHRREASLQEAERLARQRESEEAARAIVARKAALALRERKAVLTMTTEQRAARRWEERVAAWLADPSGENFAVQS